MNRYDLEEIFRYHEPTDGQVELYNRLRKAAKEFAETIIDCVPNSPDRTAAIRLVREAVMTANAGVALSAFWQTRLGGGGA